LLEVHEQNQLVQQQLHIIRKYQNKKTCDDALDSMFRARELEPTERKPDPAGPLQLMEIKTHNSHGLQEVPGSSCIVQS
jgi:hypothetical protein